MKPKVLAVDDEPSILKLIKISLEREGFEVVTANDGEEALKVFRIEQPQLAIIDLMMPKLDGFETCRQIRDEYQDNVPIIMLTSNDDIASKLFSFKLGADDYVTKPFSIDELVARVIAILRRTKRTIVETSQKEFIVIDNLVINIQGQTATKDDKLLDLTAKEFELLALLAKQRGKVCSREYLLNKIWGYNYFGDSRTLDTHIQRLRRKLNDDSENPEYIITVWGKGYKFK